MRVWKQWTDENLTTRKTGSGRRKVTSVYDDRYLFRIAVNKRTASSRQSVARWSTATSVLKSSSLIHRSLLHRGLRARDHDDHIRVKRYAGERCLPELAIERHTGLTPGVMIWGAISYHGRSPLLRIEDNFNSNSYVPQHMQLPPWPAYISPIQHVWDLVGRHVARDSCPEVSKGEPLLRIQAILSSLLQADIQKMFDSMPRRMAALIVASGDYNQILISDI
ncbi:transposable element Tcb2 transposase [Trichonephila clavipes]|nr:transposable element Tcb2 transposase [Trichonephila clavipes]